MLLRRFPTNLYVRQSLRNSSLICKSTEKIHTRTAAAFPLILVHSSHAHYVLSLVNPVCWNCFDPLGGVTHGLEMTAAVDVDRDQPYELLSDQDNFTLLYRCCS